MRTATHPHLLLSLSIVICHHPYILLNLCFILFFPKPITTDCSSPCSDDGEPNKLDNVPLVALAPIQTSSPERRIIAQKEIIAGEERPRYLLINNQQPQQQQPQQEMPGNSRVFPYLLYFDFYIYYSFILNLPLSDFS